MKPVRGSLFYGPPKAVTEVRAGYLHKSPPPKLMTTEKAWKKRFFILFKLSDTEYQLKYFRREEKDKAAGEIDLSQVSLLHVSPQHHPKWNWIQKSFKCSPSCVLFIKATEREYFLVGENSHTFKDLIEQWMLLSFVFLSSSDHRTEERDIMVKQADLKNYLTLTEVDRKPSVSGWTGQPQTVCLFHKGDQILAVNDLQVSTVEEFTTFISKSLKNEVKVTLLRQPRNQQLHLPNFTCTDWQNAN
uniref:PH domain-containing protein n=1 Tax=Astatotilapia calliptera TaxID=8154 RepID=A0AAX7SE06_ASTCA